MDYYNRYTILTGKYKSSAADNRPRPSAAQPYTSLTQETHDSTDRDRAFQHSLRMLHIC